MHRKARKTHNYFILINIVKTVFNTHCELSARKQIIPSISRSFKDQGVQTDYVSIFGGIPADDYVYRTPGENTRNVVIRCVMR